MIAANLRRVCVLSGMAIVLISGVIGCRSGKLSNPFVRNQTVTANTATPPTPPPGVAGTPVGDSSSFLSSGTTVGTTTMGTTTATPIADGGTVVANGPMVTGGSNASSGGSGVPGSTASMMTPMPNPQNTTTTQTTANPSLPTSGAVSSYRVPTDNVSPVSVALPASTMNTASSANGVTLENTMRGSSVATSTGQSVASNEFHLVGYSTGGSATFPSAASSAVSNTSTPKTTGGNDSSVWHAGNPQNMMDGLPVDNTYAGTASGSVQNSAMPTGQPLDPPIPSSPASSTPSNIASSSASNSDNLSGASGVTSNGTASPSANNVSANDTPTSGTTTLYRPRETETNRAAENNSARDSTDPTAQTLAATSTNNNSATDTSDPMSTDMAIPEVLEQLGQTENLEWVTKSDGLHLIVGTDRLFASQTTNWTSDAKPLAEKIWKAIQTATSDTSTSTSTDLNLSADAKILIIGYTDSSQNVTELTGSGTSGAESKTRRAGRDASGEESRRLSELSAKQASAMRDFAVTASNFAQDRFEILGRGDAEPRFSNGTEKGRAGNRRLEIVLPRKNS